MKFVRYGVTLERMRNEHLEMVRQWRNCEWVLPRMRYREVIEPDAQVRWFSALDPKTNWYFVALSGDIPYAMLHIKDIDWGRRCGEAGGFVGERQFIGTPAAGQATMAMMDFAFFVLQLEALQAHYRSQVESVARFNSNLGYQVVSREVDGFDCAQVTREQYLNAASAFRAAAVSLYGMSAKLLDSDAEMVERVSRPHRFEPPDFKLEL